jgi:hypothetical protein
MKIGIKNYQRAVKITYPVTFDGIRVVIPNYKSHMYVEYDSWLDDNCEGRVCSENCGNSRVFVFEKELDAVAFKLRW